MKCNVSWFYVIEVLLRVMIAAADPGGHSSNQNNWVNVSRVHTNTEVSDEIPHQLYAAVAEVLAYVFQVRNFTAASGPYPKEPTDIFVPDELDPVATTFARASLQ